MTMLSNHLMTMQIEAVRLVEAAPKPAEPWPVGYTMTVWGVGIGVLVVVSLAVSTWLRLSPFSRALIVQTLRWRLTPVQLLALRKASRVSGTPAAVLLISRSAFESAMAAWARVEEGAQGGVTVMNASAQRAMGRVGGRVFGSGAS